MRQISPSLDADDVALADPVQQVGADVVEQRDPGLDDADRPAVRVAAGDRRRAFTTATTPGLDEAVGGDPVEVAVVDDRDLARLRAA